MRKLWGHSCRENVSSNGCHYCSYLTIGFAITAEADTLPIDDAKTNENDMMLGIIEQALTLAQKIGSVQDKQRWKKMLGKQE